MARITDFIVSRGDRGQDGEIGPAFDDGGGEFPTRLPGRAAEAGLFQPLEDQEKEMLRTRVAAGPRPQSPPRFPAAENQGEAGGQEKEKPSGQKRPAPAEPQNVEDRFLGFRIEADDVTVPPGFDGIDQAAEAAPDRGKER